MNTSERNLTSRCRRPGLIPLCILFCLSVLIAAARLHTYHEPFERDITTYAVMGHEILNGRKLYTELWDQKPPLIYLTYAAAEKVAGYGPDAIYLLNVLAAIATLIGVYAAGAALGGGRAAGLWAAVFWAAVSGDPWLQANQPNTEAFINACVIWAFALMVRPDSESAGLSRFLLIGFLFAVASLFKPVVVIGALFFACCHVYFASSGGGGRRRAFMQVFIVAAVGAASWATVFGYFLLNGRLGDFIEVVFVYNSYYSGNILKNFAWSLVHPKAFMIFIGVMRITLVYAMLAILGLSVGISKNRRPWVWLIAFTIASYLELAIQGRFFNHYYQFLIPPFAVGAGFAVVELARRVKRFPSWIAQLAGACVLVAILCFELPMYQLPADEWSRIKYGDLFVDSFRVGREIDELLEPDETFYNWGTESGLYFASQRRPPTGVFLIKAIVEGPHVDIFISRAMEDLKRTKPELLVVHPWFKFAGPVANWLNEHYVPIRVDFETGDFILYARRGGRLAPNDGPP